jgi:hypothetical protein
MVAIQAIEELTDFVATAGLDMTPEKREQAQGVIIPSVIVAQVAALAIRKIN